MSYKLIKTLIYSYKILILIKLGRFLSLYQELNFSTTSQNIPETPQLLLDWLGACTGEEQQAIIKLREKILSFDERIQESIEGRNTIRYGRGKSKPVAEICYHRNTHKPIVFCGCQLLHHGEKK